MARLTRLSRSVAGRVVLVTGAASGMGRATAELFADEGARVAAIDRDGPGVEAVVQGIVEAHGAEAAAAWELDLRDAARIPGVVQEVVDRLGPVDVLVNNAGISIPAAADGDGDAYEEAWAATLDVNLAAYQRMIRACLPHLLRDGEGRIVNIASTEGLGATRAITAYTASKHGVIGLTRGLAVELGARGVTVNCVCPGSVHTGMTAIIPDEHKERFAKRKVPLRRYGDPEEIAHAVLSLALPAASYVNGAALVVDGGLTIKND
jgi:3-oxoacyl-[acyl-carrier protein] reductase